MGEDNRGKGVRIFGNNYKGHMDQTKGVESGEGGGDGWGGGKTQTTVLKQQ